MRDRSIDPVRGNLLSLPLLVGLAALVIVPHWMIWGVNPASAALKDASTWVFLLVLLAGIVVHEAIHGVGWAISSGLKANDMKYGVLWGTLTPYAHPKVPIPARAYRIGASMPGLLMGLLPALAGIATGSALLSFWGAVFLSVAGGDLLVLIKLGTVPGDVLVQDHPTRFGCQIVEPGASAPAP